MRMIKSAHYYVRKTKLVSLEETGVFIKVKCYSLLITFLHHISHLKLFPLFTSEIQITIYIPPKNKSQYRFMKS